MQIQYLLTSFILLIAHCSYNRTSSELDSPEQLYHQEMIKLKGDSLFYIPSNEVNWYFEPNRFRSIDSSKIGDVILFFDEEKNIIYQCMCIGRMDTVVKVKCLDLKTSVYYTTSLSKDSISNLETFSIDLVKCYKKN